MAGYGELLRALRQERGVSQRALARTVGLNPTLLNRSEAGDRPPASQGEVAAIAWALGLDADEHDRLLASAGYWPAVFVALGPADPTLRALAAALANPRLPEPVKADLRAGLEALARAVVAGYRPTRDDAPAGPGA